MFDMANGLANGDTEGALRVRAVDGGWVTARVSAKLVLVDQRTTAALVEFTIVG